MTLINRPQQAMKRAATHILTTVAFLSAVAGQGFHPCPHHASLDVVGPGPVVQAYSVSSPLGGGLSRTSSESADGDACLCIDGCDLGSDPSLPSNPAWASIGISSPRSVASIWKSGSDLPATNVHLIPHAQPPPQGFGHLI